MAHKVIFLDVQYNWEHGLFVFITRCTCRRYAANRQSDHREMNKQMGLLRRPNTTAVPLKFLAFLRRKNTCTLKGRLMTHTELSATDRNRKTIYNWVSVSWHASEGVRLQNILLWLSSITVGSATENSLCCLPETVGRRLVLSACLCGLPEDQGSFAWHY